MSINSRSEVVEDTDASKLNAFKVVTPDCVVCHVLEASTALSVHDKVKELERPQSVLSEEVSSEGMSEKEASLTSVSTTSSIDTEEHRHLTQSLKTILAHNSYSSFCSTCSESDLSCSTLEEDSSYDSSFTTDVESSNWEEDYSDDDGHYKLIQPPISEDHLEFWPLSGVDDDDDDDDDKSNFDESEPSPCKEQKQRTDQEGDLGGQSKEEEEEQEFCVQCHTWPEVEDCGGPPRKFYEACHHTKIDPFECAFGTSVHLSTVSLSFVDENPVAVAKRKAVESVLSTQFHTLIQQFAVNPEKVARTLYGISVIDIIDLGIATAHALPEMERATVLAVTLIRRLRRWPDLFGDVCKVLSDIPAMQEANAGVRRLLYEGFTEDQYSKMLARSVPQPQVQYCTQHSSSYPGTSSPIIRHHDTVDPETRDPDTTDPDATDPDIRDFNTRDLDVTTSLPRSNSSLPRSNFSDEGRSSSTSHDIIAQDSVSYSSKMSEGPADPDARTSENSNCACSKGTSGINLRLHKSCLENRSIRSLDALMTDEELDINSRDKNGRTPLIVACLCLPSEKKSNPRITQKQRKKIRNLLFNGADSSLQDYDGNTALHIATLRRDQEVVRLLLDRSYTTQYFSIAVTNKNSRTALHYACFWGDMELVMPILEFEKEAKSGLVGVRDRNGDTGLHIASRGGFKAIVKELLKGGADRTMLNRDSQTAEDVAEEAKHNGIAKLLRRKKSRWPFPRRKPTSSIDQVDGGSMHRVPSNSSLLSTGNLSDNPDSAEEDSAEDTEQQDYY